MALSFPADADPTSIEPNPAASPVPSPHTKNRPVTWAVIACLLLGSAAVVRGTQDRRHQDESNYVESCPFPLERIPRNLGHWIGSPEDQKLDSQTMRITGGKEHIIRTYLDELTGVKLTVLILFGPVEPVIPHTPEACYPANGFVKAEDPINRTIKYSYKDASGKEVADQEAIFRSAVYQKARLLEGVYHSFRFQGAWSPDIFNGGKFARRNPGVFKLQIQRLASPGERRDGDKYPEPIEDFLRALLPAIEHEISQGTTAEVTKAVAAK